MSLIIKIAKAFAGKPENEKEEKKENTSKKAPKNERPRSTSQNRDKDKNPNQNKKKSFSKKTTKKTFNKPKTQPRVQAQAQAVKSVIKEKKKVQAVDPIGFKDLGLRDELLKAIGEEGYTNPTPIQKASIADLVKGRDLLGCAQTGTGKTAAFALPTLHRLSQTFPSNFPIRILVLTPTRELALQVGESYKNYGRHLSLKTTVVFGGVGAHPQKQALKSGVDVLVATPGRLLDLQNQGFVNFKGLEILVLDEADRMLDMGFLPDVKRILKTLPKARQNILFSATMPKDIEELSLRLLKNPVKVEVAPVSSTSEKVTQEIYFVNKKNKRDLLLHLLKDESTSKVLIFTRTKSNANRVTKLLIGNNITAEAIHGNKSQTARQRALENFKSGETRVLVASDLAARGLDVNDISHVFNFDLPNVAETYVHRIGRTGRAEAEGKAISFCDAEERAYLKTIEKIIGKSVPVVDDHPYPFDPAQAAPPSNNRQQRGPSRSRKPSNKGPRQSNRSPKK